MPTSPPFQPLGQSICPVVASSTHEWTGRHPRRVLAALVFATGMTAGITGCAQAATTSDGSTSIVASDLDRIASGNKSPSSSDGAAASPTSGASGSGEQFVVPEAAKAHTQEGAVAFVKFYWNMLGRLDLRPQTGVIPKFAADGCKACQRQEETMVTFVQQGIHVVPHGAILTNERIRPDSTQDSVVVQFHQTSEGADKFTKGKKSETFAPVNDRIELRADWVGAEWKLGEEGSVAQ